MSFEVTAPYGQTPVASWRCQLKLTCGVASKLINREPGSSGDDVRAEAVEHVRVYGHPVEFFRGTSEHLEPLATTLRGAEV